MNRKGQDLSTFMWQMMVVILIIMCVLAMYYGWKRLMGMPG